MITLWIVIFCPNLSVVVSIKIYFVKKSSIRKGAIVNIREFAWSWRVEWRSCGWTCLICYYWLHDYGNLHPPENFHDLNVQWKFSQLQNWVGVWCLIIIMSDNENFLKTRRFMDFRTWKYLLETPILWEGKHSMWKFLNHFRTIGRM